MNNVFEQFSLVFSDQTPLKYCLPTVQTNLVVKYAQTTVTINKSLVAARRLSTKQHATTANTFTGVLIKEIPFCGLSSCLNERRPFKASHTIWQLDWSGDQSNSQVKGVWSDR